MPVTLATHAMGTRFELVLAGDDPHRLQAVGEAALREVIECHQRFNLFDPGSWLSTLNRRAAEEPVELDGLTFELLDICRQVHRDSGGAFDITVAPLMHALGFHRAAGPGDAGTIDEAYNRVGMKYLVFDDGAKTLRFTRPGMAMDLGAVAKGFAIDLAIELLREHGITCALLHGGTSTAAAIGSPPGQDGWHIKVRTGNDERSSVQDFTVTLKDSAVSVSAPHGRVVESADGALGHILDPRTGRSATCGTFAAAVGGSACLTDAWATALLVLGHTPGTLPHNLRAILPTPQTSSKFKPPIMEGVLS